MDWDYRILGGFFLVLDFEIGSLCCDWLMQQRVPKYWLIGWGGFGKTLRATRIVQLRGQFGTGKTLFSVLLAYHLRKLRWIRYASFNFPVTWRDSAAPGLPHSLNVIDEAGRLFDDRMAHKLKDLNAMTSDMTFALRKRGSYLIVPSYVGIDKRFRQGLRVHRHWPTGNERDPNPITRNLWKFYWENGEEDSEKQEEGVNYWNGVLWVIGAAQFFNVYDTIFIPSKELLKDYTLKVANGVN